MDHLITLGQIRAAAPCSTGWRRLLEKTGQNPANANLALKLSIGDIAFANGSADAFWATRLIDDRRAILRALMPTVRRAATRTADRRVRDCVCAVDQWLAGEVTVDLRAAAESARSARLAAESADAEWAAAATARAAESAESAGATLAAARAAAWAAARAADEKKLQTIDIIAEFPLHFFKDITP